MHGPVSTVLFQSSDIEDCLHLLKRFTPLRLTILRIEWVEDENHIGLKVELRESAGDIHVPVAEILLLSVAGMISAVSQGNVHPSRIELNYPRPAYAYQYQEAFKVPSFHFSRPHMCVLVSRKDVAYRTGTDTDSNIRASAIKRCEELLRGILGSQSTSERITQIFADNPGHLWTLKAMARHLNMSERTLQRRLTEEGARYRQLHNEWLMGEARKLLREKNLSIESISLLLGYSDVSNFRQAFRRWYGVSPMAYRQAQRQ
jgi:AraC-like DNA-binding protein